MTHQAPVPYDLTMTIYTVDLENVLCQINPNATKLDDSWRVRAGRVLAVNRFRILLCEHFRNNHVECDQQGFIPGE
jgi:hypothetical protein